MSLLLDALKKAEREKKLSVSDAEPEMDKTGSDTRSSQFVAEDSLEAGLPNQNPADGGDKPSVNESPALSWQLLSWEKSQPHSSGGVTEWDQPAAVKHRGPVDKTAPDKEATLTEVPEAEFPQDPGVAPYPSTADATAAAFGGYHSGAELFKWLMLGALLILALSCLSVLYYLAVTPVVRTIPSPTVAKDVEIAAAPAGETIPVTNIDEVVPTAASQAAKLSSAETQAADVETDRATLADSRDDHDSIDPEGLSDNEQPGMEQPQTPPVQQDAPEILPDETPAVDWQPITFTKDKTTAPLGLQLQDAYDAYQRGNYPRAKKLYHLIVDAAPNNRDALLGLAAIAMREGDIDGAGNYYSELLRLDPTDTIAMAALINLFGQNNAQQSESTIKSLLSHDPELPYLHFALGNIYASQLRWPEARQAFHQAHRLEPNNPNYALNLAVSLDHMSQSEPALNYYTVAIKLADDGGDLRFDTASILARIQALSDRKRP